jgi:hypothetical protein
VKFVVASAGNRRDAMRNRQRIKRINAQPLRTLYPQLDSLQLEFTFIDATDFLPSPQATEFHPPAPAYFCFACPYSDCDGEFDLTSQVQTAVTSHTPRTPGKVQCTGKRHRDVPCTLCLDFSISPRWS